MIKGLGNDIIEISRIERVIARYGEKFLDRLFTPKEQQYCQRYNKSERHFAGRFAAKEAVVKALGSGIGESVSWTDIEILNDEKGKPLVTLSDHLKESHQNPIIHISISHDHHYAAAVAIWEGSSTNA